MRAWGGVFTRAFLADHTPLAQTGSNQQLTAMTNFRHNVHLERILASGPDEELQEKSLRCDYIVACRVPNSRPS